MGMFSFIKTAGEKLFGKNEQEISTKAEKNPDELKANAITVIKNYIDQQNLEIDNLAVDFDVATRKVIITGTAKNLAAAEKAVLAAGNVTGVADVDNQLVVEQTEAVKEAVKEAVYHDVVSGDTLSAIAKKYYGNANLYMIIFEANKPMLSHPDKIYPGQKLRIPPQ